MKVTLSILKKNLTIKQLKQLGFKNKLNVNAYGCKYLFVKKDCEYIAKYNCWTRFPPKTTKLAKYVVYPAYRKGKWIVQQKVNTRNGHRAADLIAKKLRLYNGEHDMHSENCGWLNNKPMCFDPYYEN